jgi:hypothetical protein
VLTTAYATLFVAIAGAAISLTASLLKDLWPVGDQQQPSRPARRTGPLIAVSLLGTVVTIVAAVMQFRATSEATRQFDSLQTDVTNYGLVVNATGKIVGQPNDILPETIRSALRPAVVAKNCSVLLRISEVSSLPLTRSRFVSLTRRKRKIKKLASICFSGTASTLQAPLCCARLL